MHFRLSALGVPLRHTQLRTIQHSAKLDNLHYHLHHLRQHSVEIMRAAFFWLTVSAGVGLAKPCEGGFWRDLAPIALTPRQEHVTVPLPPSSLAILGGIVPAGEIFNTTDIVQIYDIQKDAWRSAAPMPVPLNHANAASLDGKIYLLGGLAVAPDGAWRAIPDSWVYDVASSTWQAIEPMPSNEARGSAAVGVYNKTIFLAGGMTVLSVISGEQASVDIVSAFDTVSGRWLALPAAATKIPGARDHAGGAVVGDSFFVLGGRDRGQANVRDTVFALDVKNLDAGWKTKVSKMPTARGGLAAAAVGAKVYTFGGEGNSAEGSSGVFNETEAYDTTSDSWAVLPPMKLPRHGTSATTIGGRIYIPGGGISIGGHPVDNVDVYEPGR